MNPNYPSLTMCSKGSLQGALEVRLEISTLNTELNHRNLEELIQVFATTGEYGGYPAHNVKPDKSCLTYVLGISELPGIHIFTLEAHLIHPNSFQILRNMTARLKLLEIGVNHVVVRSLNCENLPSEIYPEPDEKNEESVYPERSSQIGFHVEWEESDLGKSRRCLVEMLHPLDVHFLHGLRKRVELWYALLERGGFSMPIDFPEETESIAGSVTQFDEYTVEITVDRFQSSECAWDVLVNLLDAYSQSSFPVLKVIID